MVATTAKTNGSPRPCYQQDADCSLGLAKLALSDHAAAGPASKGSNKTPGGKQDDYEKVKDLARGTFGFVQLMRHLPTGEQVAVKFLERGDKVTKYVEREIMNHRNLLHPHVVQFREAFLTPQHLGIAMEYVAGGDLFHYVQKHSGLAHGIAEHEARWVFQQLIAGVDYLHRMDVASRDIKLDNVLLDDTAKRPIVKLCDFGYSKHEILQSAPGSRVGTPAYLAPEVVLNARDQTYDAKMADVWSCGVLLYVMLVGGYPFERPEDRFDQMALHRTLQRIISVDYEIPAHMPVSPECVDLLARILVRDPERRLSVAQIQAHPWYLRDLPAGVREMNDSLDLRTEGMQSMKDIKRVLGEAQTPAAAHAEWEHEEYIEDAVAQDFESSVEDWDIGAA